MLDAQKRRNLAALAKQKKSVLAPSVKEQKLKAVAEVASFKDEETCSGLVFKKKRKLMLPSLSPLTRMVELPLTGTAHLTPPLLGKLWYRRAEVRVPQRETSGTPPQTQPPSYKRCCSPPKSKGGWKTWRRIP